MKAGLLTIHDICNYGSVLQAFATQRTIEGIGADVSIIDYKYPNALHKTDTSRLKTLKSHVFSKTNAILKDMLPGRQYASYVRNYSDAKKRWYSLGEKAFGSRHELLTAPPQYGAYIIGSDQVWHPRTVGKDPSFFLDFAPKDARKISFASSFGAREIPKSLHDFYRNGLNNIDFLSVREESGAALVKQLTGRRAQVVLDPTLLLDGTQWIAEAKPYSIDRPYVLCYGENPGSNYMERLGLHIAKKTGWQLVRLNGKFHDYFRTSLRYVLDAGPREFLGLFSNAELVIGQSFHATVFAINMKRPFISLLRGSPDHDARQREVLEMAGLSSRALTCGDDFPDTRSLGLESSFDAAHSRLAIARAASFEFLTRALA